MTPRYIPLPKICIAHDPVLLLLGWTTGGYFGGEEGGNDRQNFNGMYKQRLVHFKLCPTGYCGSSCANGADYVVDMGLFVQTYLQSKMEAQEYDCEMVRENCNCENANDDEACEQQ